MRAFVLLCAIACLLGALHWCAHRPIESSPGVLAAAEPVQTAPASRAPVQQGDFELEPLADFALEARVLSRHDYTFDTESALSPTDFALGWGRMSDSAVIDRLEISQSSRFYSYHWPDQPPIPADEIRRSSANMHLIPADDAVAREISRVRVGEIVTLQGHLIEAKRADGWHWRSSLTREDSGAGACEVVLVDAIEHR
jgi:hypothetical protein